MERLTDEVLHNAIKTYQITSEIDDPDYSSVMDKCILEFLYELKSYRNAEEQGLLARLPCKIGDVLYYTSRCVIKELIVMEMRIRKHCTDVFTEDIEGKKYAFSSGVIGKTVFLTREEAEAGLAEMEK